MQKLVLSNINKTDEHVSRLTKEKEGSNNYNQN